MKNFKTLLKGLALSLISLTAGFIAISLPFHIFDMSSSALNIVFVAELAIYIVIGLIFLIIKDKKEQEKIKMIKRHEKRNKKIKKVHEEWINIAA